MKNIIVLIGSRLINGLFGLLLFGLLKIVISDDGYSSFSSSFANLTLLSTLAGGVLGGLLLKNAFHFGSAYQKVIYFYVLLFMALMVIPIELALLFKVFTLLSGWVVYLFIISHLLSSVVLVHYQLKQRFILMSAIEIFRIVFPLVLVLALKYGFNYVTISVNQVVCIMTLGNLLGLYLFVKCVMLDYNGELIRISDYLKERMKPDLFYGFSFASFNALAQLIIARDRSLIVLNPDPVQGSNTAYSADQLTKITNGVLFPLNTKVSSELGGLVRSKQLQRFHQKLNTYSLFTLAAGLVITFGVYGLTYLYGEVKLLKDLDHKAILYYGSANTIYLACLIYQKRFDYTKYKLLPTLLLCLAASLAFFLMGYFTIQTSYFLLTAVAFGLFLLFSGLCLPNQKLELNK